MRKPQSAQAIRLTARDSKPGISFPRESSVRLDIYNMAGQWITRLVEEPLVAGQHTVKWTPTGLPSGVYIYRLQAEEYVKSQRMLLIR